MTYKTMQEEFWAGPFGSDYSTRNVGPTLLAGNVALFARILSRTRNVTSIIEFGANIGLNLRALRTLLPSVALSAVELNGAAVKELEKLPDITVYEKSLLGFHAGSACDLTLSKGVLIHIDPEQLEAAYETLYRHSRRYICIAEYYNPTPVEVPYRGHSNRMFKRDFAGELLSRYSDVRLIDYGFVYRNDPTFPLDDLTWFLLEKGQ